MKFKTQKSPFLTHQPPFGHRDLCIRLITFKMTVQFSNPDLSVMRENPLKANGFG